jgi:hypothetical protein
VWCWLQKSMWLQGAERSQVVARLVLLVFTTGR